MRLKKKLPFVIFFPLLLIVLLMTGCFETSKNKEEYYKKAMAYLEQHKEKEAIIELRNAIQADPKYADARYQLGLLYLKAGEVRQAFGELQRAASLDPKNLDAKIKTAEFFLLSQKKEDARKAINEVLAQSPENKDALALLANMELIDGNADAALAAINKALQAAPDEDRMYSIKGRVLTVKKQFADAEQALVKAVELNSNKMANFASLAAFYTERKEYEKAFDILDKMAVAFPNSSQPFMQKAAIDLSRNREDAAEEHLQQALKVDPKNGRLKLSVAEFYEKKGKLDQAEALYKDAVASAGDDATDFEAKLADFYFDHGKFDQAKAELDKVIAKNAKNAHANLVQAKFLLKEGKNQEALDRVSRMLDDYPKWGELYFVKAVAHSNLKDFKLAKEALLEAIKYSPGFAKAHSLLGLLSLQEGEFETAKREAAIALKLNPRDFQAALTLAKAVLFSKDYETAEKMFSELHKKVPENVEVLGSLGLTYLAMKTEDQAKQTFEKLLNIQPDNAKAYTFLLRIAKKEGASQADLIKMTKEQVEKAPKSGGLQIILANLYLGDKKPDEALALYTKAQELDPNNPQPYAMSALILTRQGKTDQAIGEYKDLLAKQPKAIGAYMGLGSIYEQTGRSDLAREAYTKALDVKPDFAPAANNLAWMIAESKDPDLGEALRLAMIAKQQKPDDVHIIDTLGWVHYKRGSFSLARNEFVQAVEKEENMPILRYHLALALYGEGKKQEAMTELQKALAQQQPFPEKEEAAATLRKWQGEQ
ncbi:MAG: tetratricopeptide repeat protein [Desulfobulbus sp.]